MCPRTVSLLLSWSLSFRVGGAVAQWVEHENPSPFDLSGIPGPKASRVIGSRGRWFESNRHFPHTGISFTRVDSIRLSATNPACTTERRGRVDHLIRVIRSWLWHGVSTSSPSLVFTARPVWADGRGLSGNGVSPGVRFLDLPVSQLSH